MEYVLQTSGLTKKYQSHTAVDQVDLTVRKGAIYGLIGRNGAGKTTLMRLVTGLAAPDSGSYRLFEGDAPSYAMQRVGCMIEAPALFGSMSAHDNLETWRRLQGITDRNEINKVLKAVKLEDTGRKKVNHFSLGMKQRLSIAMALLGNPDFLLLDEPTNGLDPEGIIEIRDLILTLNRDFGITFIISSHILGELSRIATCYGILNDGKLVEEFDAGQLKERCQRCLKLVTDDPKKASYILEQELEIHNYDVLGDGSLRVFDRIDEAGAINMALTQHGILVKSLTVSGQDLEEYFIERMGTENTRSNTWSGKGRNG